MIIERQLLGGLIRLSHQLGEGGYSMMRIADRFLIICHDRGSYSSGWWFRICGHGLAVDYPVIPPLFSERYGYRKTLRIGRLRIERLRRRDMWTGRTTMP
jgi:hypothetical protein